MGGANFILFILWLDGCVGARVRLERALSCRICRISVRRRPTLSSRGSIICSSSRQQCYNLTGCSRCSRRMADAGLEAADNVAARDSPSLAILPSSWPATANCLSALACWLPLPTQ